ncbi:hypothetical protein [Motilimonas sp. KMU-193]|uniref:hypothetical protein n=1 Tax=Motilimonas sp. KMU-193 TaxID=3388668 RepID=UPI00396AFC57
MSFIRLFVFIVTWLITLPAWASFYQCDFGDKVVFSSQPCDLDVAEPSYEQERKKTQKRKDASREFLTVGVFPGWGNWQKIKDERLGSFREIEHIPEGQSQFNFSDLLNEQWLTALPKSMPAERFATSLKDIVNSVCDGSINEPIYADVEKGVGVAYGKYYCGRRRGTEQGVIAYFKALRGKEAIYLVTREWRVEPFDVTAISIERLKQDIFPNPQALSDFKKAARQTELYLKQQAYICPVGDFSKRCRG